MKLVFSFFLIFFSITVLAENFPSVGYNSDDIWYERLRSIEKLNSNDISEAQKAALIVISRNDPDWRIKQEASKALSGEDTRSMVKAKEMEVLEEIGDHPSVGYNSDDIWYNRLESIEKINVDSLSDFQMESLLVIGKNDPDPRIRNEAFLKIVKRIEQESLNFSEVNKSISSWADKFIKFIDKY